MSSDTFKCRCRCFEKCEKKRDHDKGCKCNVDYASGFC